MDSVQEDECCEALICFVVPCYDASELFEIAEDALDEMPPAIHGEITRDAVLAIRLRRNDGLDFLLPEQLAQTIVVEPLVGQQRLHVDAFDQVWCGDAVLTLAGEQDEAG